MSATYSVVTVDLTQSVERKTIVPRGFPMAKLTVRRMPVGTDASLHFGEKGQAVPLITQGERFALCPSESGGLYITIPPGQGGTLVLLVSADVGEVDSLGAGVPNLGDIRSPRSPIHGSVETNGSLNGPATIHLLNPVGSLRLVRLRKLQLWCSTGQVIKVRRTSSPIDLAGAGSVLTDDTPVRLDERDATSILAEFRGTTFTAGGATFTRAQSQWQFPITDQQGNGRFYYLTEEDFPQSIREGSAVEIAVDANGAGTILRAHAVWDED